MTVELTTLEKIVAEHNIERVHFPKMDCEGSEFDILLNSPDSLLAKLERISMEVHRSETHDPRELCKFLASKGFEITTAGEQVYAARRGR